jgi:hypothetical protein
VASGRPPLEPPAESSTPSASAWPSGECMSARRPMWPRPATAAAGAVVPAGSGCKDGSAVASSACAGLSGVRAEKSRTWTSGEAGFWVRSRVRMAVAAGGSSARERRSADSVPRPKTWSGPMTCVWCSMPAGKS